LQTPKSKRSQEPFPEKDFLDENPEAGGSFQRPLQTNRGVVLVGAAIEELRPADP
jgi:hypothetical protein